MVIRYGNNTYTCESAYFDGKILSMYVDGNLKMQIANIPDIASFVAEGGVIETPESRELANRGENVFVVDDVGNKYERRIINGVSVLTLIESYDGSCRY